MRLIDADELIVMELAGIKFVPKEFIDDAPTIDAEPAKHAYMLTDEDGNIECSNCGSSECWGNYCMNCGARMDGGEE